MGYLQDAELGLPWEGKPIDEVLADQQAQNVRLLKMVSELEQTVADWKENYEAFRDKALFGGGWACIICGDPDSQHAARTGSCRTCWRDCLEELRARAQTVAELRAERDVALNEVKRWLRDGGKPASEWRELATEKDATIAGLEAALRAIPHFDFGVEFGDDPGVS
jgi:hypothetical protein